MRGANWEFSKKTWSRVCSNSSLISLTCLNVGSVLESAARSFSSASRDFLSLRTFRNSAYAPNNSRAMVFETPLPLHCVGQDLQRCQPDLFPNLIHQIQLCITFFSGNLFLQGCVQIAAKTNEQPGSENQSFALRKPQPAPARSLCLLAKSTAMARQNRTMSFRTNRGTRYRLEPPVSKWLSSSR